MTTTDKVRFVLSVAVGVVMYGIGFVVGRVTA